MGDLINKGIVKAASFMRLKNRMNYFKVAPEAMEYVMALEKYVKKANIDQKLKTLVKVYASQLNGCSYCIEMHTKEAKKLKISDKVLNELTSWRESELFNEKERISLELTEHITHISSLGVNDLLYQKVRKFYDEKAYFDLVIVINQINSWNRLSISMGNTSIN